MIHYHAGPAAEAEAGEMKDKTDNPRVISISDIYRVVYSREVVATFYEFRASDALGADIWVPIRHAVGPKVQMPAPLAQQIPRMVERLRDEIATKVEMMLANGRDGASIAAKIRDGAL